MKKIISGMLICTVLLNSFSVIASGEELVKTETTGRLAWSLKLRQKQRLIQRRIHLLLQKKIPLKAIVLLQAQKKSLLILQQIVQRKNILLFQKQTQQIVKQKHHKALK